MKNVIIKNLNGGELSDFLHKNNLGAISLEVWVYSCNRLKKEEHRSNIYNKIMQSIIDCLQ